jgi:RNA recognition motif-containing protein
LKQSQNTNERQLWAIFGRYGEVQRIEMVRDRFSGQSRGFAFVYFTNVRDASRVRIGEESAGLEGTLGGKNKVQPIGRVQARKGSTNRGKHRNQNKQTKNSKCQTTAISLKAKERLDDSLVDGMRVRVDFSVTPHGGP